MSATVRVATRGSTLALAQTNQTVERLQSANAGLSFELVTVKTTGDRVIDKPLWSFRGTGVFVKELEQYLLEKRADIAVHSLKDVPTDQPQGLTLAGFPARATANDVLLTRDRVTLDQLKQGAVVGTSSPRRMVQLKSVRLDLRFEDLRGNLDTRIGKLEQKLYDAIVVAAAGMERLGRDVPDEGVLPFDVCLPAIGQGALAIECREDDPESVKVASSLNDADTALEVAVERSYMSAMGGGCRLPMACLARIESAGLKVCGMFGDPDAGRMVRDEIVAPLEEGARAGEGLAARIKQLCDKEGIAIQ